MVIQLERPFSDKWKTGYLYIAKNGRRTIHLHNTQTDNRTMSYARYLMSVKLGRFLKPDEHVDHIDNDKTNDSIENLQLLSRKENTNKYLDTIEHHKHGTSAMYKRGCRCPLCVEYIKTANHTYWLTHPEQLEKKRLKRKTSKDIQKHCEFCGSVFYRSNEFKNARFCSKSCASRYRNQKLTLPNGMASDSKSEGG